MSNTIVLSWHWYSPNICKADTCFSCQWKPGWLVCVLCLYKKILNVFHLEIHSSCSNTLLEELGWVWVGDCGLLLSLFSQHIYGTLDFETSQPATEIPWIISERNRQVYWINYRTELVPLVMTVSTNTISNCHTVDFGCVIKLITLHEMFLDATELYTFTQIASLQVWISVVETGGEDLI